MANYKVVNADQLDSDLRIVGDAIREKTGGTELLEFPQKMGEAIRGILNLFQYLETASFKEVTFPEGYEIILKLPKFISTFPSFNNSTGVRSIKVIVQDKEACYLLNGNFQRRYTSEIDSLEIVDISETSCIITHCQNMFSCRNGLKTIVGKLEISGTPSTSQAFYNLKSLVDIEFVAECIKLTTSFAQSPLLSDESIQSIIDGLADLTDSETQTASFHNDVIITAEQRAQAASKNWNIVGGKEE